MRFSKFAIVLVLIDLCLGGQLQPKDKNSQRTMAIYLAGSLTTPLNVFSGILGPLWVSRKVILDTFLCLFVGTFSGRSFVGLNLFS